MDAVHLEPEMGFQYVLSSLNYLAGYPPGEHRANPKFWMNSARYASWLKQRGRPRRDREFHGSPGALGTVGRNRSGE